MNQHTTIRRQVIGPVLLILVLLNLLLMTRLLLPLLDLQPPAQAPAAAALPTIAHSPTPEPTAAPTPQPGSHAELQQEGMIILSMRDGADRHLFAYQPQHLPLTRLTGGAWDDVSPALSPDGSRLAFASHRDGFWDLYVMDLGDGAVIRVTNTPDYDGAPSWSPDGEWLAYESYINNNLEILIRPVGDLAQAPVQITNDPAQDGHAVWSPAGGQLAFVSNRSGEDEIWLAQIDASENRFRNLSASSASIDSAPAWSPDGASLLWAADVNGLSSIMTLNVQLPDAKPQTRTTGAAAIWSPDGGRLLVDVQNPNDNGLMVLSGGSTHIELPYTPLPGLLAGMTWRGGQSVDLVRALLDQLNVANDGGAPQPTLQRFPIEPVGRFSVVQLRDVLAPYPMLHDGVDESYQVLRQETAARTGWDFLGSLENAFIPLTRPPVPGMEEDWLYTGRAFSASPALIHAGWMTVCRENRNGQIYWRVYLKARYQDGSQGQPLRQPPWDLDARYNDTRAYEQGGQPATIPAGYWIDFTDLARGFGWERLPALLNWTTYYPGARFNQFAYTNGMDWRTAMSELYPPEALQTAAPDVPPTP